MSTITAENILKLIEQLPSTERARLQQMLAQESAAPVKAKAPRDKRVPCEPMPDDARERQWVRDHKHEYPGQWVALDGDRLNGNQCCGKDRRSQAAIDCAHSFPG